MLLLAPASRKCTLDIIAEESFEVDVMFLLQRFNMYLITFVLIQKKLAIDGISDGASYAFSLGLTNGIFFRIFLHFHLAFM